MGITAMTGQTFGRLLVLAEAPPKWGKRRYLCRCACGKEKEFAVDHLMSGMSQSCGCRFLEIVTKHGQSPRSGVSPEYQTWKNMMRRCYRPKNPEYGNYGARGITVCERWMNFENFFADMGPRPSPKHSIDRENNDGNYELGNCRWATMGQQNANRRPYGASGVRGVCRHGNRWRAVITIAGRKHQLGSFKDLASAAAARRAAEDGL